MIPKSGSDPHTYGIISGPTNSGGHLQQATRITLIVGQLLSTICLAIRLRMKWHLCKELLAEDLCLAIAWGFCFATQVIVLYALEHAGLGFHVYELTEDTLNAYGKLLIVAACLFVTGLCFARFSYLIFFHRLASNRKRLRYSALTIGATILIGSLSVMCCFIFACRPIAKSWDVSRDGQCIDRPSIFVAVAVLNIVSDLSLVVLPLPIISDLNISRSQKFRLMIFLVVVCMTFVATAIRLRLTIPLLGSKDLTYGIAPVVLLVGIEANLVVITASLPALRQGILLVVAYLQTLSGPAYIVKYWKLIKKYLGGRTIAFMPTSDLAQGKLRIMFAGSMTRSRPTMREQNLPPLIV